MSLEQELANDLADRASRRSEQSDAATGNRLNTVQRVLRGRYPYAILLALVGLVVGGYLGYIVPVPQYCSTSQIRIAPVVPKVLYSDEEKRMLPRFEAFIETQVMLIQQQDIIKVAASDPDWQSLGGDAEPATLNRMARSLQVDHPKQTETIHVHFYDPDPRVAQAGINSITRAYLAQSRKADVNEELKRIQLLEERREALTVQLTGIQAKILDQANMVGTESLTQLHQSKLSRAEKLQEELDEVQMAIYTAQEAISGTDQTDASVEAIASVDSQLRQYLAERELLTREIARLKASLGDEHRAVREQMRVLAGIEDMIHVYVASVAGNTGNSGISVELVRLRTR